MKQNIKKISCILGLVSLLCFFIAIFLYTPVYATTEQGLKWDADGVNITASATDVYDVASGGEFTYSGQSSFITDTATNMSVWFGGFGTDNLVYWTQNAYSALTLNITSPVAAAEYDTVEIKYLGTNYNGALSALYIYVFGPQTTEYIGENALCSFAVLANSNAELAIQIPSELLADDNGNVSSFTIARGYQDKFEVTSGLGVIDYVSFYNSKPAVDNAIYTELYVEEAHSFTGAVYAWTDGVNYLEIRDTIDGYVYNQDVDVSEVISISTDGLVMIFKNKNGDMRTAELIAYDLYLTLSDEHRGFGDSYGWEELKDSSQITDYITINGVKLKNITSGYKVNAGGPRTLYFRFNYGIFDVVTGDSLVLEIPEGTRASKNYQGEGFEFIAKTVCTLDKQTLEWTISTDEVDWGVPTLGQNELSDCSHSGITVYTGKAYEEKANYDFSTAPAGSVIDANGRNWHTNSQTELLAGSGYTKTAPKGDGSNDVITGNFYKMSWGIGLDYPSMIVEFPYQTAEYDKSDYLVIKLYVSSKITAQSIWFTNIDTAHVDNGEKVDLPEDRDTWSEVKIKTSKFLNADGTAINPIGITFFYGIGITSQHQDNEVYFDSFSFQKVVRNIKENYTVNDLSEVVPVSSSGYTFKGEWTGEINTNNYQNYIDTNANIAFVRFDANVSAVKMKVKAVFGEKYNFYFTINAPDFRYDKGGVNYWFSNEGISIGGRENKALSVRWEDLPSNLRIASGVVFTLELGAVPYMVDGVRSGFYGYIKINGTDILNAATIDYKEKAYIDEGDVGGSNGFGNYFGLYLHDSTNAVAVTVYPETMTDKSPLIVSLKTRNNVSKLELGESVKLLTDISMDLYGGKEGKINVLDDSGAYLQGRDTLVADKNGKFKAKFTYDCCFGLFESNTLQITIGNGMTTLDWIIIIASIAGTVIISAAVIIIVFVKKKKKSKNKN